MVEKWNILCAVALTRNKKCWYEKLEGARTIFKRRNGVQCRWGDAGGSLGF